MDLTPPEPDHFTAAYSNSSTPITHLGTRKRKHDGILNFSSSPKFSSTLNESLITGLQDNCSINSLPSTPEKRNLLALVSSPIQESRKILYSTIKVVKPERDRKSGILRFKNVFDHNTQHLLNRILNINVIMEVIFKYLSGGDLYRFSLVSESFYRALEKNDHAFERFRVFKLNYKDNKENYVITPPGSPEKCDSPPRTSSEKFNKFFRIAQFLNQSQTLTKCRKCDSVAVVENDISQCQNIHNCGLIYCLRCMSSSETGAKDFKDACGHASLRLKLGNMSNHMEDVSFNFSNNYSSQDSGFYSEHETPPKVKRNLFNTNKDISKPLSSNNKNRVILGCKRRDSFSYVPVVSNAEQIRKPLDSDSPPRYGYAAGSKQSKKNLKRLTR